MPAVLLTTAVAGASSVHKRKCKEYSETKTQDLFASARHLVCRTCNSRTSHATQAQRSAVAPAAATPHTRSPVDIYKMTNTCHPERLAYVGQAVQFLSNGQAHGTKRRVASHFREAHANLAGSRALNAAIREENSEAAWAVETLDTVPFEDADAAEVFWIDHFNTYKGPGYNLTPGGQCFAEPSAESRAKLSMSMRKHDGERSMYIHKISAGRTQGYGVSVLVIGKHVSFTSINLTMPAKLARAEAYLKACPEALAIGFGPPAHQIDTRQSSVPNLPRYVSKFTRKGKVYQTCPF